MIMQTPPPPPAPALEARGRPLADIALETIWYHRRITRAELARRLEISRSTSSEVVTQLLASGLILEVGDGPSRGGRRPIVLEFNDSTHVILGVDMGASHVGVLLTDLRGRVLAWREQRHPVRTDPEGTRALIQRLGEQCLDEWAGDRASLLGIGVAVPSPVDHRTPDRLSEAVLPAWQGQAGFHRLREHFGAPVFVDNDANLGAVAERWWGVGRGIEHFTYVKLATGIGAGHMIGGSVYRGASNVAGEIGHLSIDPNGAPCVCGNRGCLSTFVGGEALVRRALELRASYPDSPLSKADPQALSPDSIEQACMDHDPLALQVVREAAHHLGVAVAGLLNLLNPGAVIFGGSLVRVGEHLLVPLRETVVRRTLVNSVAASEIRVSELGPQAIALGAATYVLSSALSDPSLFPSLKG